MKNITFDFMDGRGAVPAHQHKNHDKSVGGWVENNCTVSADTVISSNSSVYNNSRVDNSRVYNSRVYNSSVDNLKIKHTKQIFSRSHSRNDRATAIWNLETNKIIFIAGCFSGNEKEFKKVILKKHGHTQYGEEYLAFIQNAKEYFNIWKLKFEK